MGHCRLVGDIRETFRHKQGILLEWEIPDFFLLPDSPNCIFYSPDFFYGGASYYLFVYPSGQAYCSSQGWIVLFLCRRLCSPQTAVRFSLGIRRADGVNESMLRDLKLPEGCTHLRVNEFLLRSDLLKRRCQLAPSNCLTVTCAMYRDETPRVQDTLTYSDEQKPTSVQFKFSEQMHSNVKIDNILTYSDETKPTSVQFKFNEKMDNNAKTDNILAHSDEPKPISVQFKFNEQMDKNAKTSVSNKQRDIKQAVKCILKYFGNCMGRLY